jgi:glycosyltransferase involved in cell wall biosynthesis
LACGTPILTYRTGGSVEAVSSDTGFIVEKHDLEAALQIIKQVKAIGKEAYSEKCRERAVTYFNKDDRFKEYVELFTSLLESNK